MQALTKVKWHDVMIAIVVMVGALMVSGVLSGHPILGKLALAVMVVGASFGIKVAEAYIPPGTVLPVVAEAVIPIDKLASAKTLAGYPVSPGTLSGGLPRPASEEVTK